MARERREQKEDMTIPPNMTVAWGTSDVSYCDATFRTWREDVQKHGQVRLLDIARDEEVLPEDVYKRIFMETLKAARNNAKNVYHYVRLDNRKYVVENSNNEPFSARNGWSKHMNLWGYEIDSHVGN